MVRGVTLLAGGLLATEATGVTNILGGGEQRQLPPILPGGGGSDIIALPGGGGQATEALSGALSGQNELIAGLSGQLARQSQIIAGLSNRAPDPTDTIGGGNDYASRVQAWVDSQTPTGIPDPTSDGNGGGPQPAQDYANPAIRNPGGDVSPLAVVFEGFKGVGEAGDAFGNFLVGEAPGKPGVGEAGILEQAGAGWRLGLTGRATDPRTGETKSLDPFNLGPNKGPLYEGPDPLNLGPDKGDLFNLGGSNAPTGATPEDNDPEMDGTDLTGTTVRYPGVV